MGRNDDPSKPRVVLPPQSIEIKDFRGQFVGDVQLPHLTPENKKALLEGRPVTNVVIRVFTKSLKITQEMPKKKVVH